MKIIKITESQYKRLVSKKLNESIIYNNSEDKSDVTILIRDFLKLLSDTLLINHKQNVYVDKIVDGVVYIDGTKYNEEEKNLIEYFIDWWVDNGNVNTPHKKIDGVTYDSGKDWDYNEDIVNDTKCWCNDEQNGEEIEYLCVDGLPNNCVKVDDVEVADVSSGSFTSAIPVSLHSVMFLISKVESGHNYDIQGGEKSPSITLTDKTINQVSDDYGTNAKGRWQLMPKYIKSFAKTVGLKNTDKFSKINQDKMAMGLIDGWDSMDCKKLGDKISKVWAAVPVLYDQQGDAGLVERGDSYYKSVQGNKALIDADNFETALRKVCSVEIDSSDIRQKIVDKAYSRLGEPYEFGDEFDVDGEGGDCSGFIDWTLRNVSGINSPYSGRETSDALQKMVTNENMGRKNGLDKGDILIFTPKSGEFTDKEKIGHVGFVYNVKDGKVDMIHSSSSKGVNIQKNVFANSYYKNHYYGAIPIVNSKYESK